MYLIIDKSYLLNIFQIYKCLNDKNAKGYIKPYILHNNSVKTHKFYVTMFAQGNVHITFQTI